MISTEEAFTFNLSNVKFTMGSVGKKYSTITYEESLLIQAIPKSPSPYFQQYCLKIIILIILHARDHIYLCCVMSKHEA